MVLGGLAGDLGGILVPRRSKVETMSKKILPGLPRRSHIGSRNRRKNDTETFVYVCFAFVFQGLIFHRFQVMLGSEIDVFLKWSTGLKCGKYCLELSFAVFLTS